MHRLLALLLLLTPSLALAEVIDTAGAKAGTYILTIGADGTVAVSGPTKLTKLADLGPGGPVDPQPETLLQVRVKQLTREALAAGGKPETAAKLAGAYALISDYCLDGTVSPDQVRGTADKPGFLSAATDAALKDATDKAAWTAWRTGVGTELALRHPATAETTKELLAGTLREVSGAIKTHLGGATAANGEKLTIPWSEIIELLRPLLRDLLLKFLTEWIKGL